MASVCNKVSIVLLVLGTMFSSVLFAQNLSQDAIDLATPTPFDSNPVTEFRRVSGDYRIDSLVRPTGSRKWGGPLGTGAIITYSFPTAESNWVDPYENRAHPYGDFVRNLGEPESISFITEEEKVYVRDAFDAWEAVANIQFFEIIETATQVGAIRIARTDNTLDGLAAHSSTPSFAAASADIWFRSDVHPPEPTGGPFDSFLQFPRFQGASARWDLLHEIGHSLGLHHPFDGPEEYNLSPAEDDLKNTVMSYSASDPDYVNSLPLYDQLAIQYLYGPKDSNDNGIETDYDYFGTSRSDELIGMSGDDEIYGLGGDDKISVSGGSDLIDGGTGLDTLIFGSDLNNYEVVNSDGMIVVSPIGNATATQVHTVDVERFQFADRSLAFDFDAGESAGNAVRLIATTLGASYLDPETLGIGIDLFDAGADSITLVEQVIFHPLFRELAGGDSEEAAVAQVIKNITGRDATSAEINEAMAFLISQGGSMTLSELVSFAMSLPSVDTVVGMEELRNSGVEFLPVP